MQRVALDRGADHRAPVLGAAPPPGACNQIDGMKADQTGLPHLFGAAPPPGASPPPCRLPHPAELPSAVTPPVTPGEAAFVEAVAELDAEVRFQCQTWKPLQYYGPNHLGLRFNGLPSIIMAPITSGVFGFRS